MFTAVHILCQSATVHNAAPPAWPHSEWHIHLYPPARGYPPEAIDIIGLTGENIFLLDMYCENCGCQLGAVARFCDECGSAVEAPVPMPAPRESPVPKFELANADASLENGRAWVLPGVVFVLIAVGLWLLSGGFRQLGLSGFTGAIGVARLTPEQMVEEINTMCRNLDGLQAAKRIDYWTMWNYCSTYTTYMAMALAQEGADAPGLRKFHAEAKGRYEQIRRSAGLSP